MTPPKGRLAAIAEETGVSSATVSRTFNNPEVVKEATRLKVLEASKHLGLGVPALQTLGLIVPDASNPFFSQLIYYFERELARHAVQLISSSADGKTEREVEIIERFRAMGVDGVIYTPTRSGGDSILELVSRGDLPVLAFDRQIAKGNFDCVTTSARAAIQTMVDYLYNQDHRRFGYICGAEDTTTADERHEAFAQAIAVNGLEVKSEHVYPGNYRVSAGRDCAEVFLQLTEEERPTAMVAANDLMAIGFIQRVQEAGLRVPQHVSVAGFDGIEFGAWYSPSLTTVIQPVRRLVREAVDLLLERIALMKRGEDPPLPKTASVEPRFVVRDSVGRAPSPERDRGELYVLEGNSAETGDVDS